LLARLKREDEAERCYHTALTLDASYDKARFNLAYVLLRQGRFEEGWQSLEARDWYAMLSRYFTCPRWQGEPLNGRTILIGLEAGHGDMIQFCRYASLLKAMGASRVAIVCHPGLTRLFASLLGIDEVFSVHDDVPKSSWDFWTPPMSMPYHCITRIDTVPAPIPYLAAEADKRALWGALLPTFGRRVGLVWKGSASFENDLDRSLPSLDVLAPLGAVPASRRQASMICRGTLRGA
jgi:tetratricopeptide (TPR) repeat protein